MIFVPKSPLQKLMLDFLEWVENINFWAAAEMITVT